MRGRTALAEAVDRDVDQIGANSSEGRLVEAEPTGDAGSEVFHEEVGGGHQAVNDVAPLRALQVDGDGALAAVHREERRRHPGRATEASDQVAATRALDLDHLSALVGQHHGGHRPSDELGQIDDPDSIERGAGLTGFHVRHVRTLARTRRNGQIPGACTNLPAAAPGSGFGGRGATRQV